MNNDGITAKNSYTNEFNVQNGQTKTYSNNKYYPNLYVQENGSGINTNIVKKDGIERNDSYYSSPTTETYTQASSSLTVTMNYYYMTSSETINYFDDKTFYEILFKDGENYWLASRVIRCNSDFAIFNIRLVTNGSLANWALFYSSTYNEIASSHLRPIISLSAEVKIYGGDGSEEHPYQLTI